MDQAMGMEFMGNSKSFMEHGPHRIGAVHRKAIYRAYTDETFTTLKPRPDEWEHAGILGPILRAEVGDTIKILFKNNGTHPYSMHPHGVFYQKHSEGRHTSMAVQRPISSAAACLPAGRTPTRGRRRSARGPGPPTGVPSSGCITPTPMRCRT